MIKLLILPFLFVTSITIAQTTITGKIEAYPGEKADVLGRIVYEKLGTIDQNGAFSINLDKEYFEKIRDTMKIASQNSGGSMRLPSLNDTFACATNSLKANNSDQIYLQLLNFDGLILANMEEKKMYGHLKAVSSNQFAQSHVFRYQNEAKKGYMVDWYYFPEPASLVGTCSTQKITDNGENYQQESHINLNFKQGWNLVKYEVEDTYTSKNGKKYIKELSYTTLNNLPEDVKYLFVGS
ncbi:MAG: hypothetical protein WAM00_06035 [Salegentibacter sp.]